MSKARPNRPALLSAGIAVTVLAIDQTSKAAVLTIPGGTKRLSLDWVRINVIHHRGAFLGMLDPGSGFWPHSAIVVLNLLALACLMVLAWVAGGAKDMRGLGIACMIGGALGNLADRLGRGFVVDFFEIAGLGIFNAADFAIGLGLMLAGAGILKMERQKSGA